MKRFGYITSIDLARGFGFVSSRDESLFFHKRDLGAGLEFNERLEQLRVSFRVVTRRGKPEATDIAPAP